MFTGEEIRILKSPPRAPRTNATCERVIGELRRELLDRMLIINEEHLRRTLTTYLVHRNEARPHRGLGQLTPVQAETGPPAPVNLADYRLCCPRLLSYGDEHPLRLACARHPVFRARERRRGQGRTSRTIRVVRTRRAD